VLLLSSITAFRYFMPTNPIEISNVESVENEVSFSHTVRTDNRASILMNLDTNQVLFENNIQQSIGVYSVSKVMFLATVYDYLQTNNRSLDEVVEVIPLIDIVNTQTNFSTAHLRSGQRFTIRELFDAAMMPSGNDACILLGEVIFGGQGAAVNAMNALAQRWGMVNSSFISTSGLDGKYLNEIGIDSIDGKNMMSVYDIVIMTRHVKEEFPEIIESSSKVTSTIGSAFGNPITLGNVNGTIDGNPNGIPGVFGLKTGSNIVAGSNAIVSLKNNEYGQTLLAVSLASNTRATLASDVRNMFNYASSLQIVNLQDHINIDVPTGFTNNQLEYTLERPFMVYVNENQQFTFTLDNLQNFNRQLNILNVYNKGEVVGEIVLNQNHLFLNNQPLGLSRVVVANQPERMSFVDKIPEFVRLLIEK